MVKLNMTVVGGDEGSITPKAIVYQRTPTPRYKHWPQSPSTSHFNTDPLTSVTDTTERHKEDSKIVITPLTTKLDVPHSDSTAGNNNTSCDPPDDSSHDPASSSHDPDSGSKDCQDCSHDPDSGSCSQTSILPINNVHAKSNSDSGSRDGICDTQDLNSQANS